MSDGDLGRLFFFFFAAQVFHTALLKGPSVRAEAGQNVTAGTFTF